MIGFGSCERLIALLVAINGISSVTAQAPASPYIVNGSVISDTYFYGLSPSVYPSPPTTGTGNWKKAYEKAAAFVAQLTLEEKTNLTGGVQDTSNGCAGNIAPIPRLGFPGLCLQDAGNGVRATDFVNGYPAGVHVAASFNRELTYARSSHMAKEFRVKGVNVLLGPTIGPLGRVVLGGRNWETFSVDPYLTGQLAYETVAAAQREGVITSTKHWIANEQETYRNPSTSLAGDHLDSLSSNIDDTTLHEAYVWPFMDALRAGTGNIMCSYQKVNNSWGCQNSKLMNGILKEELGFQGFVVSDWGAQHSGVASALSGLDMAMPNPGTFWGTNLTAAVKNGSVPTTRLDDMATRILASWYYLGQDEGYTPRGVGLAYDLTAPHKLVNAKDPASKAVLMQGAVEGHVLVKNINNALPLKKPKLLSIYGYDAKGPVTVLPASSPISVWALGVENINITEVSPVLSNQELPAPPSQIAQFGNIICGGGSATIAPAYWQAPFEAIQDRAIDDDTSLFWDFETPGSTSIIPGDTDACLVFINAWSSEQYDRSGSHDAFSDNLVLNIAKQCSNTIVVIHNAGVRLVDQFVAHPNVTAIVYAHLPGQASARALVSLLYGDVNFSGKLPYTVAKNESDYGHVYAPEKATGLYKLFPQSDFTEGVYIDYRSFDARNITPRYEFGFGLSYTTFAVSDLTMEPQSGAHMGEYPVGHIEQGGQVDLWDQVVVVTAKVKNTGTVTGQEVVQLYVGIPGAPARQLRGFEKVALKPGQERSVRMVLTRRDLSVWDVVAQKWKMQQATYSIWVGTSSRNLPLAGKLVLDCKA